MADPIAASPPATPGAQEPRARAYLFRGFAGLVFSRGMDALAERIEHAGFAASVSEAMMCPIAAKEAIGAYRADPAPIVVIGHSVGGACALAFAGMLDAENIPVKLVVTTEPARISHDVPPNVERYINIFQSNSILGGHDVVPANGFHGHYASFDLAQHGEINHLNIEKSDSIHEQLLTKIQQIAATPANREGETAPISLVVPADSPIELWDSGMPVFAHADETLPALAEFYHVPVWSLEQSNRMSGGVTLAPGQRVIVPRHLVPLAALNTGASSGKTSSRR